MRGGGLHVPAPACLNRSKDAEMTADIADVQDSAYAWRRLTVSLALSTLSGIGLWAPVVVLPSIQAEFGVDRAGASVPYTAMMVGFAAGGVLMGRIADRVGIMAPMVGGALALGAGFS